MSNKQLLFSYGTLQSEEVQTETYGRLLTGTTERLLGYKLDKLKITDTDTDADADLLAKSGKEYQPIAVKTNSPNDFIEGMLFEMTTSELAAGDKYAVSNYKRVLETFASGQQAWVYVAAEKKPQSTIAENIANIRQRMAKVCQHAGRDPKAVKLLLATKTVDSERIKTAFDCGETLIAENKVQEVKQKFNDLKGLPFEQHFIGHLQTNKIKELLKCNVHCIQSLDRISLAEKLHNRLTFENKNIEVLIQVNTSGETSKFGVHPDEAVAFVEQAAQFSTLKIKGLMTIGLFSSDPEKVRGCFKLLKSIQQAVIEKQIPNVEMQELSMGMSGDLEIAIEEGATIIRVGTAIFGERQYPDSWS